MGTATTKDVNSIKEHVNQLTETQSTQQENLVHIVSILNVTRYAMQVNRHSINILMDKMDETSQDVNNLYNLTTSLATSISYDQIVLYMRSVLANLRDSLSYIKTVSTQTMDYIDAATTGTLSPHILPIMDLKKMLSHIEQTLLSTLHLTVLSEDTLHFYCYLCTHVLITNKQFLLLIDVPIQDQSQQLSIYKIFTLNIPHDNFTACYDISTQYLKITQDETMAMEISPQQFRICQEANGHFVPFLHHFNHLQTHCLALQPCMPRTQPVFLPDVLYRSGNLQMSVCLLNLYQMFGYYQQHPSSIHHNYPHRPGRNNSVH